MGIWVTKRLPENDGHGEECSRTFMNLSLFTSPPVKTGTWSNNYEATQSLPHPAACWSPVVDMPWGDPVRSDSFPLNLGGNGSLLLAKQKNGDAAGRPVCSHALPWDSILAHGNEG